MIHRKTYSLASWRTWDRDLDTCARDFAARFGVMPNVMLASSVTYNRINMAADRGHVGHVDGEQAPAGGEYVDLCGFAGEDYVLNFAVKEHLPDQDFALLYDADPDGGEPWPEADTAPSRKVTARR